MNDGRSFLAGFGSGFCSACGLAAIVFAVAISFPPGARAAELRTTVQEVNNAIMSPACPGKILSACPSAEGAQLRELVRRKVEAGETLEQIVQYFVDVYGPEVLPVPPPKGFNITAWLMPFMVLFAGLGVVVVLVRAWSSSAARKKEERASSQANAPPSGGVEDELEKRLQRDLEEYSR